MNIHIAAKYLELGYRIKREQWDGTYLADVFTQLLDSRGEAITLDDLLADDWEIVTEGIVKNFPITYSD